MTRQGAYGPYVFEGDVPSGKAGKGFITLNGRNEQLFYIKNFNMTASFDNQPFKCVGDAKEQNKVTGVRYAGSMTIYDVTPAFLDMIVSYQDTGVLPYFAMQITNEDPGTTIGAKTIRYIDCRISEASLQTLDVDQDWVEQNVSLTAYRIAPIEKYTLPAQVGG